MRLRLKSIHIYMRTLYNLIPLVLLLVSYGLEGQEPSFELRDLENQWTTYQEVKGENLTVIDFWATWCQPCLRSIPEINNLYINFQDRGVNFIGISIDGPRNQSKLKPYVKSLGITYKILRDVNSEVMADMNITVVPTLLILNKDGDILFLHEGYRPGDEQLIKKQIEKYL